jgi:hypothetical protein
LAAD